MVKLGKLGQFLEEERGRNPGLKIRLTSFRMWKKRKEGEYEEEMEEKGEVEPGDNAGGPFSQKNEADSIQNVEEAKGWRRQGGNGGEGGRGK